MNTKPGHDSDRTIPSRERVRRPRRGLLGDGPEALEGRQLLSTDVWQGGSTNFNDPTNWSTNAVPSNGDTLIFGNAGAANSTTLPDTFTAGGIEVQSNFVLIGTLNVAGTVPLTVDTGATLTLPGTKMSGTGTITKLGSGTLAINTTIASNSAGIIVNAQQGGVTLGTSGSLPFTFDIGSAAKLTEVVDSNGKGVSINGSTVNGASDGTAGTIEITPGNTFAPAVINNGFYTIDAGAVLSPTQINGGYFTQLGANNIATDQALNGTFTMHNGGLIAVKASNFGSTFTDGLAAGTSTPNDFTVNVVPDAGTSTVFGSTVTGGGKFHTSGLGNVVLSNGIQESNGATETATLNNSGDVVLGAAQNTLATSIDVPNAPTLSLAQWSTLNLANSSLTVDKAAVSLNQNTALSLNINGTVAGKQYGQLVAGGGITLNNATLTINPTFAPAAGTVFTILKTTGSSTITGQFASLGQGTVFTQNGIAFQINYSSNAITLTSQAQASTTTISANTPSIAPGEVVTLTAKVAGFVGSPTGTVTFKDGSSVLGSAPLVNGLATLSGLGFAGGNHSITASYGGDNAFTPSTSPPLAQAVRPLNTLLVLYGSPSATPVGQTDVLIGTVTASVGTPTGQVTFYDGTTSLGTATLDGNGHAVLPVTNLAIGTHSLTASYSGDANDAATSTIKTQSLQITTIPTNVAVASTPNPATYGQATNITAYVYPTVGTNVGSPGGYVSFYDGTTLIGSAQVDSTGHATISPVGLPVGKNTFKATYQGDANFASATNVQPTPETIVAAQTITSLSVSPNPPQVGHQMLFTANVNSTTSGVPTGSVTFKNGGKVLGKISLTGGQAFLVTTLNFSSGQTITATYNGNSSYTGSTSNAVVLTPPVTTAPPPTVVVSTPAPTPVTIANPKPVTTVPGHTLHGHKVAHPKPVKIVVHHPAVKKHK